jgi:hemerythrin-like metal-binding protein
MIFGEDFMDQFPRLDWQPQFTMHDEVIDLQHKNLYRITNKLIDQYENGPGDCYESIKELVDYASKHFHTEQLLMMKSQYPDTQRHIEEHEYFGEKIKGFIEDYKADKINLTWDVLSFLREWIFFHTTGADLKLAEHLLKTTYPKEGA